MSNKNSDYSYNSYDWAALSERLKLALGRKSFRSIAMTIGLSDSGLKRYFNDGTVPPIDKALDLSHALGVDFLWLCTGEGSPYPEQTNVIGNSPKSDKTDEFTLIDSYAIYASAGHGSEVGHELSTEPMSFRTDWLKKEGFPPERLAVIRAKGDSMEPTISDNDVILILLTNGEAPRDGLHVLRLDGGLFVKRLQFDPLGSVHVRSDNPVYGGVTISKEERSQLHIVGRVVWAGKKF